MLAAALLSLSVSCQDVDGYLTAIEDIRELHFLEKVEVVDCSADEVKAVLKSVADARLPGKTAQYLQILLKGFMELGFEPDVVAAAIELIEKAWREGEASPYVAVYDVEEARCKISDQGIAGEEELTAVHELTHALQDQRGWLDEMLEPVSDHVDRGQAWAALIEGEAQLVALLWFVGKVRGKVPDELLAPQRQALAADLRFKEEIFLRRGEDSSVWFLYDQGTLFCDELVRSGGWEAVTAAHDSPPASTEQVLHPVKFAEPRDAPVLFQLPDNLDSTAGWTQLYETTLGEYLVRLWLQRSLPRADAVEAATGWDGDRFALYRVGPDRYAAAGVTLWDREQDAEQFAAAAERRAAGHPTSGSANAFAMQRQGSCVAVVLGPDLESAKKLAGELVETAPKPDGDKNAAASTAQREQVLRSELEELLRRRGFRIEGDTLTHDRLKFQLRAPSSHWFFSESTPNPVIRAMLIRPDSGDSLNVVQLPRPDGTLEEIARTSRDQLRALAKDGDVQMRPARHLDQDVYEFDLSVSMMGREAKLRQTLILHGDSAFTLTRTLYSEDEELALELERAFDSFSFIDEGSPR